MASYAWCIAILAAGYLLKWVFSNFFSWLLFRFFKRFSGGVAFKEFRGLLLRPFNFLLFVLVLYLAFNQLEFPGHWNLDPVEKPGLRKFLFVIFQSGVVVAATWVLLRIIDFIGVVMLRRAAMTETKLDDQFVPFFKSGLKIVVCCISFLFILSAIFNVNVAALIGGLGIGGLALALASKETVENLFGSVTIFLDKPFQLGDNVKVGSIEGTVEGIGLRSTKIRTLEKSLVAVPNKKMIDADLENITLKSMWRCRQVLTLTYQTSPEQLQQVSMDIQKFLHEHELVRENPLIRFFDFSPSSLDLLVVYFVLTNEIETFLRVREEVNFAIMQIVKKNNCSFAFPTQSIYFENKNP